jgi:hypothetical protein
MVSPLERKCPAEYGQRLWARKPAHAHKLKVSMGTSDLKVEK